MFLKVEIKTPMGQNHSLIFKFASTDKENKPFSVKTFDLKSDNSIIFIYDREMEVEPGLQVFQILDIILTNTMRFNPNPNVQVCEIPFEQAKEFVMDNNYIKYWVFGNCAKRLPNPVNFEDGDKHIISTNDADLHIDVSQSTYFILRPQG